MDTASLIQLVLDNWSILWPALTVAAILAVLGRFFEGVFTREHAYTFDAKGNKTGKRPFWYWMRESLPVHPIATGMLLGCVMPSPDETLVATRAMIILYYGAAGMAGLVGWVYLKAHAKKIPLPGGESAPPPA